ncbi:MAG: DUF523 domain-containing protein [Proteobacteria bacterium]|nr:DUF523 domain-containing protein [Pseudomonadota bacterium]
MIKLGVSACLMGQKVRYDGKDKYIPLEKYFDLKVFELIPICPEVEMGMSIPRPPIQIINDGQIKLVQVNDHCIDYTSQMKTWFNEQATRMSEFSGLILKSKSPSCGNQTTPHFQSDDIFDLNDGLFVQLLKTQNPAIALIDEIQIKEKQQLLKFIKQISKNHLLD